MKQSLKQKATAKLNAKEERQTSDRISKLENVRRNIIHDGLSLNPRPSDLAVDAGSLFKRNADNDEWQRVSGADGLPSGSFVIEVNRPAGTSIADLGTPTGIAIGYLGDAGTDTGAWLYVGDAWIPLPSWQ